MHSENGQFTDRRQPAGERALVAFYEDSYTSDPERGAVYERWRALGALGKAEHVIELCARAGVSPRRTLDVGCGDGALLAELHRRGFGGTLAGVEIARAAVAIAARRPEIESVALYDGEHLELDDGQYDLAILSHVLEHALDPVALLAEVARCAGVVVLEVPLEANVSASRASKLAGAAEVGHLRRLDRDGARAIVERAGLRVAGELTDPLPREVQRFFADSPRARTRADIKWALRASAHRLAPALARRLFTVHYACLAR